MMTYMSQTHICHRASKVNDACPRALWCQFVGIAPGGTAMSVDSSSDHDTLVARTQNAPAVNSSSDQNKTNKNKTNKNKQTKTRNKNKTHSKQKPLLPFSFCCGPIFVENLPPDFWSVANTICTKRRNFHLPRSFISKYDIYVVDICHVSRYVKMMYKIDWPES